MSTGVDGLDCSGSKLWNGLRLRLGAFLLGKAAVLWGCGKTAGGKSDGQHTDYYEIDRDTIDGRELVLMESKTDGSMQAHGNRS